jgi:hypothetical protein
MARSKADAVEKLDEVANAEGCPMVELSEAQVHFTLTDDGQLVLEGLGEGTAQDIFEFCYPVLGEALAARGPSRADRARPRQGGSGGAGGARDGARPPDEGRTGHADQYRQPDGVKGGQAATPIVQAAREAELTG